MAYEESTACCAEGRQQPLEGQQPRPVKGCSLAAFRFRWCYRLTIFQEKLILNCRYIRAELDILAATKPGGCT